MTTRSPTRPAALPRSLLLTRRLLLATLGVLALLLWLDRSSLERGNRLYHEGRVDAAEQLYRPHVEAEEVPVAASYNLGTALLSTDAEDAEAHLRAAAFSPDSTTAQRGSYNLGYSFLTRVDPALEPDSAITLLTGAVASSRRALRLNPADEDARWNLALSQRMLDSLTMVRLVPRSREEPGEDDTRIDQESLTRSGAGDGVSGVEPPNAQPADNIGQRSGASTGAREAWTSQDPGPMDATAARGLLDPLNDNPEELVRGILWAHRPDVEWWNAETYPGGDW